MQFIKGQDVDSRDARSIKLKGTKLVLVNPMRTHELAQRADHDEGTWLEVEDVFARGLPEMAVQTLQHEHDAVVCLKSHAGRLPIR